uniref:CvpA family protein n=1 Tax=candidate division CPR3 bacterium TaxID=2268181 RepID=A0A7C4M2Q3_UNCC3
MTATWDLFIIIFFIIAVIFGIAMGRERSMVGVIAAYIGLVVSNVWGNAVYNLIGGDTSAQVGNAVSFSATASPFFIKAGIFILVLVLLIVKGDFLKKAMTSHSGVSSIVISGIYSFLNAGIIVTALVSFLGDAQRTDLLTQSNLINLVQRYNVWWMVLPVALMIIMGFKDKEEA